MKKLQFEDVYPYASISTNNHEQKVYEKNTVFLNNGQNFEIKLFNPSQTKLGVNVSINGQSSDKLLVLNPGQQFTLDRFLDDKKKMIFETYTVDGSNEQVLKAIENNGNIEISFYKEKITPSIEYSTMYNMNGMGSVSTFNTINRNSRVYSKGFNNSTSTYGANINSTFTSAGIPFVETDKSFLSTSNLDFSDYVAESKSLETGRVEKGEESNQNFKQISVEFETTPYHTISYKLLPISQKETITTQEIRMYCTACSYRKRKPTWKFCPACGEKY